MEHCIKRLALGGLLIYILRQTKKRSTVFFFLFLSGEMLFWRLGEPLLLSRVDLAEGRIAIITK